MRALLVNSAEEYKWSSAGGHAGGARENAPVLDGEFWEAAGGVDASRRLHGRPDRVQEVRLLRRCPYAGRPFGEEEFVREIEERFHRRWRRWGFELAVTGEGG
ncbi:MAG: hypothetical protein JNN08_29895, partial [Bryobacterales bacterium]|nr:hypothetical protein [Bryobacterales bacterium]